METRAGAPLLDPALFRRPAFLAATSGALFTGLGVIGLFSYLPALLQQSLGMSELDTSWLFLLWSGTALLAALQVRRLPVRFAARHQLALGFALSAAGALTMLGALAAGSWARTVPGFFVAGVGSGLLNAALPRLAVESVPADRTAMGSGATTTRRATSVRPWDSRSPSRCPPPHPGPAPRRPSPTAPTVPCTWQPD